MARVNPALGNYISLQWSVPYDISASGGAQSDWFANSGMAAIKDKPAVAYGYHAGFYAIDNTKTQSMDKQINLTATGWDKLARVIIDQEAYPGASVDTPEVALAPVIDRLIAGSHIVISDPNTADTYGAYRITGDATGADGAWQLNLAHIRSAGDIPGSGRGGGTALHRRQLAAGGELGRQSGKALGCLNQLCRGGPGET